MSNWQRVRRALYLADNRIPAVWQRLGRALCEMQDDTTHAQCLADLPSYVGAELEDAPVARLYPVVQHHLDWCEECAAQYVELLEVALADMNDALPKPRVLPSADLSFLTQE